MDDELRNKFKWTFVVEPVLERRCNLSEVIPVDDCIRALAHIYGTFDPVTEENVIQKQFVIENFSFIFASFLLPALFSATVRAELGGVTENEVLEASIIYKQEVAEELLEAAEAVAAKAATQQRLQDAAAAEAAEAAEIAAEEAAEAAEKAAAEAAEEAAVQLETVDSSSSEESD
jgi:hypothetical protein